ncbi:hypothetical protein ACJRO7_008377 [Eucalyptus globulus]|uniref:Peptidase A1 domain-containing protein n=1 Tax=Eucalyptus globulus TaxID=34317 RepID=A0ABD3IQY5_EUCGL
MILDPTAYKVVAGTVSKYTKDKLGRDPSMDEFDYLCYADVSGTPAAITIMFKGLAFEISQKNAWETVGQGQHCLTILSGDSVSILGVVQQRDVNVGFDRDYNYLSLQYTDCPLVPDQSSSDNINDI